MELTLSSETHRLVEEKLKEGIYQSADEVVQAALRSLNARELLTLDEETLDAIDEAEDAIERGDVHDWKDVKEQVKAMFKPK